jgi:serine/threonine protein kinase
VPQAVTILQGILAGLAAAHAQGIIHRDLKPENVFLAREPSGQFQIKLLDFGIAKVMDVAGGMGSRTRTGALLGTPAYMSPEQVKNPRNVEPRSDLWSAGIMTWEMLSGRTAFPAPTEYARLAAVTTFTPDALERIDPQLGAISPIVERAMQKDPAQRFASALEMARALAGLNPTPVPLVAPEGYTNPNPTPLSRLPAVASVFGPAANGISPGASSERRTPIAEDHLTVLAARPGGGTLQSAAAVHIPTPPPPRVLVIDAPAGSTMPSHDLPVLEPPRGALARPVAAWVVVILVVCALAAGFVLGFAVARPM